MSELYNSLRLTQTAATISKVFGVNSPSNIDPACDILIQKANDVFGGENADRVFIYNPDAIALWIFQKYTALFKEAVLRTNIQLPILSVMPSVTPVCFASMYTGVIPEVHGIQKYEKPVLKVQTVFDTLITAGKKCAIVSTEGDSISKIFLERKMDYFIYETHEECNEKALELIKEDNYDLIVLYNGNYDSTMHRYAPESEESIDALKDNIATFSKIHDAIKESWKEHKTMLGFCPDHGCHEIDGKLGSHGLDMEEDMNIIHMFSFIK
ncbi:MAG: hypothetical protein IJN85_04535 [Oscillospiraceae bacterium]|nr:hypothetical protein [Oscillospiraceae bacterium]